MNKDIVLFNQLVILVIYLKFINDRYDYISFNTKRVPHLYSFFGYIYKPMFLMNIDQVIIDIKKCSVMIS